MKLTFPFRNSTILSSFSLIEKFLNLTSFARLFLALIGVPDNLKSKNFKNLSKPPNFVKMAENPSKS